MPDLVFDVHLRVARVYFVRRVVAILVLLKWYGVGLSRPTAACAFFDADRFVFVFWSVGVAGFCPVRSRTFIYV